MTGQPPHDYAVKMVQTTLSCVDLTYPHESLEGTGLPGKGDSTRESSAAGFEDAGGHIARNVGGLQQPEMALG